MTYEWFCPGCKAQLFFKLSKKAKEFLEHNKQIVIDCDCGNQWLITKKGVRDYRVEMQVAYFRYLLKNRDIIKELM